MTKIDLKPFLLNQREDSRGVTESVTFSHMDFLKTQNAKSQIKQVLDLASDYIGSGGRI